MFTTTIKMPVQRLPGALQKTVSRALSVSRREVVIVAAARTPMGSFRSSLSSLKGCQLGAVAIRKAVLDSGLSPEAIEEAFIGTVLQGGQGQAPARQAVLGAGLPHAVRCTTVNKVCASSMKAVALATQAIALGDRDCVLAGGYESMSQAPFILPRGREGLGYGHGQLLDEVVLNGLTDPYNNILMGNCGEKTCRDLGITREDQDAFAMESYLRAQKAQKEGTFNDEIAPVTVKGLKGRPDTVVTEDEEPKRANFEKMKILKPAFDPQGTITAANASKLNDGGVALVLTNRETCDRLGLKPLARVLSYGDAEVAPIDFGVAPIHATEEALKRANVKAEDIAMWEVNEAFSCVALAHQKHFGYSRSLLNIHGGAVALGHPIGMSGGRLVAHMAHWLKSNPGKISCGSICNGGGGASAIVLQGL